MSDWKYGFATHELREEFIKRYYGEGPAEHDYLKHYMLKPGDIFVEAGANVGRHGFLASCMQAQAILIEPSPLNLPILENKIKEFDKYFHYSATIVKKALWKEKKVAFFVLAGGKADRLGESGDKITPVECDTLLNILNDLKITKVNLFACDIEGAEVEIVKQLDPEVELNIAIASYHLGEKIKEQIINVLEAKGYKNITYEDGLVFASSE
jgi:FkbM family methyltransferase